MYTTSSINFYCRESKKNKSGLAPIEVSVIINGKRELFNLTRKEKPKDFKKFTSKMSKSNDLVEYLEQTRRKINEIQTQMLMNNIPITAPLLKEYIRSGGQKSYSISDMFNEYLPLYKIRIGTSLTQRTYDKYTNVRDLFLEFMGKNKEARSVQPVDILKFYSFLNSSEKPSTSAGKMTKLKTIFQHAFNSGRIPAFPFSTVKISKPKPNIEFLNLSEIDRIMNYEFDNKRLEQVRDAFVFQMSSGLSYGDIATLEPGDLQEHNGTYYIKKNRIKTGIEFTAVVLPIGVKIYDKYDGQIPVLSNQNYNVYLKEIADVCHIHKNITSHLARKTYATMMLNEGISITSVSKMLGHSNTIITQRSYAKTLDETIFEEVSKHIGKEE